MPQKKQTDAPSEFLPKTFYFFYYAAMASLFPFLALHYEQIGLDKQQIGLLAGIPPILVLLGGSLWGAAADATRRHKLALAVAIVGAVGPLIGGSLYQHIGPFAMYRWGAIGLLIGLLIFIIADRRTENCP